MPLYCTQADIIAAVGTDATTVSSDHDGTGSIDTEAIATRIRSSCRFIESYAEPYGVIPAVGADVLATAGTFPGWWREAAIEIAVYQMSLGSPALTKEKRQRYEDWRDRLKTAYPTSVPDGTTPIASSAQVSIVAGSLREFTASKQVGL